MLSQEDDRDIEKAVEFLADAARRKNDKSKPVILHSLRVAVYLYNHGYGKDVVTAGVLHDTIEASGVEPGALRQEFGENVARLVQANTHHAGIRDKTERYRDMFTRCTQAGNEALSIKAADLLDNLPRHMQEPDPEERGFQLRKVRDFLEVAAPGIGGTEVYEDLLREFEKARA